MADIKYQVRKEIQNFFFYIKILNYVCDWISDHVKNDLTYELSPKGKILWMTLNGEHVSDSQFCIDLLIKKYSKDLSAHLSPASRAWRWSRRVCAAVCPITGSFAARPAISSCRSSYSRWPVVRFARSSSARATVDTPKRRVNKFNH